MKKAFATLVIAAICTFGAPAQSPTEKHGTIAFLQNLQSPDGGFMPAPPGRANSSGAASSLRATSGAVRALKHCGGAPRDTAACARFVTDCWDKSALGFVDQPHGKP